jgi:hypothetical protein
MLSFVAVLPAVNLGAVALFATLLSGGCAREHLEPSETFTWCEQRISFSPPPAPWRREAENSGGLLGVRFVLTGGLGERITVATYPNLAKRDRRDALTKLIAGRDSLKRREFLDELSLARARTDDPLTEQEGAASLAVVAIITPLIGLAGVFIYSRHKQGKELARIRGEAGQAA